MAPENFTLSSCLPDDVPEMVEVSLRAFAKDPLNAITLPREIIGEAELRSWTTQFLHSFFDKPEIHFYKMTETNTGTLAAWIRCAFPHVLDEQESQKRKKEKDAKLKDKSFWPKGANFDVIEAKFGTLGQLKEKYCDDTQTYCKFPSVHLEHDEGLKLYIRCAITRHRVSNKSLCSRF